MRTWIVMVLALGGCVTDDLISIGVPPEVDVDVSGECEVSVDDDLVRFKADDRVATVSFSHDCEERAELVLDLDDPGDGFGFTGPNLDQVGEGEPFPVEIELLASEPGTYEAQLTARLPEWGSARTIELIGEID